MKISPRYGGLPILELDGPPGTVAAPLVRQRRRFARLVTDLTPDQWEASTRCDGWRVKDVVAHLTSVDRFWNASVQSGLRGEPTRFLDGFDPKSTPAALVDAVRDESIDGALTSYLSATEAFCASVEAIDPGGWTTIAESPAGHVDLTAIAHHALWDAWVHERDVLLPLAMTQDEEGDEVAASLRYAAALSPMFALQYLDPDRRGTLVIEAHDPEVRFTVVVAGDQVRVVAGDEANATLRLEGRAVDLIETLSVRAPFLQPIPPEAAWLVTSLATVFEEAR
jgi:uncharacterized protein (TIGR03083 family)